MSYAVPNVFDGELDLSKMSWMASATALSSFAAGRQEHEDQMEVLMLDDGKQVLKSRDKYCKSSNQVLDTCACVRDIIYRPPALIYGFPLLLLRLSLQVLLPCQ